MSATQAAAQLELAHSGLIAPPVGNVTFAVIIAPKYRTAPVKNRVDVDAVSTVDAGVRLAVRGGLHTCTSAPRTRTERAQGEKKE